MAPDGFGGRGSPPAVPAARHRADEHALVQESLTHPDAVAEYRPARERARWIHSHDGDAVTARAIGADERADECRFAAAGRAGHADHGGLPGITVGGTNELRRSGF